MIIKKDYPYMYARISAKKAKLLEEQDYEDMVKMKPNGIARKLEEGDYKEDINELGSHYDGVELVELGLMRNLSRSMGELIEIAPEEIKPIISSFLRRYDIRSLKRILRWKKKGGDGLKDLLTPVGRYDIDELMELSEKDFDEICDAISFPDAEIDYQSYIEDAEDLKEIERNLDRAYYAEMEEISQKTGSVWFRKFMDKESEFENVKIAFRLRKYGLSMEEMKKWAVTSDVSETVKKVIEANSLEGAVEILKEEGMVEDLETSGNIEDIEHSLEVERLRNALRTLHLEPLGATSILGYILAKLIEIKNLRMLIRAKETGIQNSETIRSNLVIA